MTGLRWLGGAASAAFIVSAYTPVWNAAGERLAVAPVLRPAEAIVVLGGGVIGRALVDESLRRTVYGIELYKRGMAPMIVFSGPPSPYAPRLAEAEIRKQMALRMGIPEDRIITVSRVLTTRDESQQIAAELANVHAATILLVTDALHMRRAMAVFERAGLKTLPAPSDDWPHVAVAPSQRLLLMWRILVQTGGLFYYRLAGYI